VQSVIDQPSLDQFLNGSLYCDYPDVITPVRYNVGKTIRRPFSKALEQSYIDGQWKGKPYAALIAACISSITGQHETATEEVDAWLRKRHETNWYDLRMRGIRASLTEYWLTAEPVAASNASLAEVHRKELEGMVQDLMKIPGYDEERDDYWRAKDLKPSFEIEYAYAGDQHCTAENSVSEIAEQNETQKNKVMRQRKEDLAILKYTQISYMITYIDWALKEARSSHRQFYRNMSRSNLSHKI
jgi:hypothetical protein